jgi:L-ascorbate metabolism protein UlaG (beta-lactamase superfamily)
MCFIDTDGMGAASSPLSRRGFLGGGLVAGAAVAATSWSRALGLPGVAEGAETPAASGGPGTAGVSFKWFGTNGWEITFGNKTILIDPWFNRFESGFLQNKLNHDAVLPTDTTLIDQHVKKADQILIGHGHWDHMADVPYIAKKTGAMVIGSETHANVMRAAGVPEGKIVPVKGGEYMQFDGYTIEVFPSVHSMGGTKKYAVPGHLVSVPTAPPTKVGDLPEGDTLIYVLRIGGKYTVFLMSSGNYVERAIAGLKPDVALIAPLFSNNTHDFTPRLVRALDYPKLVLPTHWDHFEAPLSAPPTDLRGIYGDPANLDLWVKEMKKLTPRTRIVTMNYFGSYAP